MIGNQPTVQEVYAQIKGNSSAYAELMSLPDQDALVERLVQICHEAGLKDITATDINWYLYRDLGDVLYEHNDENGSIVEDLALVAASKHGRTHARLSTISFMSKYKK